MTNIFTFPIKFLHSKSCYSYIHQLLYPVNTGTGIKSEPRVFGGRNSSHNSVGISTPLLWHKLTYSVKLQSTTVSKACVYCGDY